MLPRLIPLVLLTCLTIGIYFSVYHSTEWRSIPQALGLGEGYGSFDDESDNAVDTTPTIIIDEEEHSQEDFDPNAWRQGDAADFKEPIVETTSLYPAGQIKPTGSNYTKCVVIPRMIAANEDVRWVEEELGDMLASGLLTTAIYGMDDPRAKLQPPKNKGHEVMAYLSYLIDFYDELPDVVIFMHAHRYAYHNNMILDRDSSLMVRHLSGERVTRDGYMNLRCHWEPGCPEWVHPGAIESDAYKQEEIILANSWAELFPNEKIPTVLAQPCCGQFAVSRERIRAIPRQRFIGLRDWLLKTPLSDFLSGRVFEYTWQYIFTASPVHCPSMSACYCDGYGLCFGDPQSFDYYFELNFHLTKYKKELAIWDAKASALARAHNVKQDAPFTGDEELEVPEVGRNVTLRDEIERIEQDMKERRDAAFERGEDPKQRAKEAGRAWEDGGF